LKASNFATTNVAIHSVLENESKVENSLSCFLCIGDSMPLKEQNVQNVVDELCILDGNDNVNYLEQIIL
jgi:hypothetical protein